MRHLNDKKIETIFCRQVIKIIVFLIPVILLTVYFFFMKNYSIGLLDSDQSSELILAKLLSEENRLLSTNWYYSTELRVLNTQLIFAPLFKMFSSYHAVRVIGSFVLMLILFLSAYFFSWELKIGKAGSVLFGSMLLLPYWGAGYFQFVMNGVYYVPYLAISFVTLGMVLEIYRTGYSKKIVLYEAFLCILALLAGMGGLRQIFVLYLPLWVASVLQLFWNRYKLKKIENLKNDNYKNIVNATMILVAAFVGYMINSKYLSKIFSFKDYSNNSFDFFNAEKFNKVMNGFFSAYGYKAGGNIFSIDLLNNLIAVLIMIAIAVSIGFYIYKKNNDYESQLMAFMSSSAIIIMILLYSFSTMDYADRYLIPVFLLPVPLLMKYLRYKIKSGNHWIKIAVLFLIIGFAVCGIRNYKNSIFDGRGEHRTEEKGTEEKGIIVNVALNGNCNYGYASFWNANVLTELSNGRIAMHDWGINIEEIDDVNKTFQWLQLKKHDHEVPSGRVFCVFDFSEYDCLLAKKMNAEALVYESDSYKIFIYDSYEELINAVSSYQMNVSDSEWLKEGNNPGKEDVRKIYNGGVSYGPYITLYPGKYRVLCEGEGLDVLKFDVYSGGIDKHISVADVYQSQTEISYQFELTEKTEKVETRFYNNDEDSCAIIKKLEIMRE